MIAHRGQPIAMVVAETLEVALHARTLIRVVYEKEPFAASISSSGTNTIAQAESPLPQQLFADYCCRRCRDRPGKRC